MQQCYNANQLVIAPTQKGYMPRKIDQEPVAGAAETADVRTKKQVEADKALLAAYESRVSQVAAALLFRAHQADEKEDVYISETSKDFEHRLLVRSLGQIYARMIEVLGEEEGARLIKKLELDLAGDLRISDREVALTFVGQLGSADLVPGLDQELLADPVFVTALIKKYPPVFNYLPPSIQKNPGFLQLSLEHTDFHSPSNVSFRLESIQVDFDSLTPAQLERLALVMIDHPTKVWKALPIAQLRKLGPGFIVLCLVRTALEPHSIGRFGKIEQLTNLVKDLVKEGQFEGEMLALLANFPFLTEFFSGDQEITEVQQEQILALPAWVSGPLVRYLCEQNLSTQTILKWFSAIESIDEKARAEVGLNLDGVFSYLIRQLLAKESNIDALLRDISEPVLSEMLPTTTQLLRQIRKEQREQREAKDFEAKIKVARILARHSEEDEVGS